MPATPDPEAEPVPALEPHRDVGFNDRVTAERCTTFDVDHGYALTPDFTACAWTYFDSEGGALMLQAKTFGSDGRPLDVNSASEVVTTDPFAKILVRGLRVGDQVAESAKIAMAASRCCNLTTLARPPRATSMSSSRTTIRR